MNTRIFLQKSVTAFSMLTVSVLPIFGLAVAGPADTLAAATPKVTATVSPEKINLSRNHAVAEVDRRVGKLTVLIDQINAMKRLTAAQKQSFVLDIRSNINELSALKSKIINDNDPAVLKTDIKSIVSDYRIYLLYVPKIRILSASDRQLTSVDTLNDLSVKLKSLIDQAATAGKDVTDVTAKYNDMLNQTNTLLSNANAASAEVINLLPGGYPGNASDLKDAQAKIKSGHQALTKAVQDATAIRQELHVLLPSIVPAATVTP